MTAPTKSWSNIADSAIDPDSPVDTALMTALRDNDIHLRDVLFGSYTAGVQMDHNHDGVNSAMVEVGPNALRNGSFEAGTASWTTSAYTGGTVATNTANDMDGATALAITSTVLANGGGEATSDAYNNCAGGLTYGFRLSYKASVANVSSKAEVLWYDDAQAPISTSTIYTSTNTPTTATSVSTAIAAPATARYYRVKLTGGIPATGASTGTVYFDAVEAHTGVITLNGQTGDIVDTTLYAIGSFVVGRKADITNHTVNSTIAGSSLYATGPLTYWNQSGGAVWSNLVAVTTGQTLVNTGSWRCVSPGSASAAAGSPGLWVRYA